MSFVRMFMEHLDKHLFINYYLVHKYMPKVPTTKKQCDRTPGYSWVKGHTRDDGTRIKGYCRKGRSRSTSRYVYVSQPTTRTVYVQPARSPRRVYVRPARSPRRVFVRPTRTTLPPRTPAVTSSCTSATHPANCPPSRCSWTGTSCLTR